MMMRIPYLLPLVKDSRVSVKEVGEGTYGLISLAAIVVGGATMDEEIAAVMVWELLDAAEKQSTVRLLATRVIALLTNKSKPQLKSVECRIIAASSGDINSAVVQIPALTHIHFSTRPDTFQLSMVKYSIVFIF